MKFGLKLFLGITILLASTIGSAERQQPNYLSLEEIRSKLRFGAEMTISNQELLDSFPPYALPVPQTAVSVNYINRFYNELYGSEHFLEVSYAPILGPLGPKMIRLTYPDGFWLKVDTDPGVLELNSRASSIIDIERHKEKISRDFFGVGKKLGLEPALFTGSGHIHIEMTKVHPDTARNFIADLFNHTGLFAGALNEDVFNAIGPGELPGPQRRKIKDAFKFYDNLKVKRASSLTEKIKALSYRIALKDDLPEYQEARNEQRYPKYHAIAVDSMVEKKGTLEIRAIRPQQNVESYIKLLEMFVRRMEHSENMRLRGELVELKELVSHRGNPHAVLADFDRYLSEVGLDIRDYKEFVMPWWQNEGGEFDQYMATRKDCSNLLR